MIHQIQIIVPSVVHLFRFIRFYQFRLIRQNKQKSVKTKKDIVNNAKTMKTTTVNPVCDPLQFVLSEWTGQLYAADATTAHYENVLSREKNQNSGKLKL